MTRHSAVVAFAVLALAPAPAFAHAHLVRSKPAAGATLTEAPKAIGLDFSEAVVPRLCDVAISDKGGKAVKAERPTGGGASISVVVDDRLAPGSYTVTWRAVSVDSHRTTGHFAFTVAP